MKREISLLPYADTEPARLKYLMKDLAGAGVTAALLPEVAIPADAYNPARGQYDARLLLQHTREHARAGICLGVTDRDLYVRGLNFVFGLAESPGTAAIISLYRLMMGADERTARERAVKEAVHELGHAFGLGHCPDPACVMHFSNSLNDTDSKGKVFCAACRGRLKRLP